MYNYNIELTYNIKDNDTLFRKEMLDLFQLKQYDDSINEEIDELYLKYCKNNQLVEIIELMKQQKKFTKFQLLGNTTNITYFMLLFSFDYLYLTHKCLQNLDKNNKINDENYNNLCNKIKIIILYKYNVIKCIKTHHLYCLEQRGHKVKQDLMFDKSYKIPTFSNFPH